MKSPAIRPMIATEKAIPTLRVKSATQARTPMKIKSSGPIHP
jgi:hypothetical protein